MWLKLDLVNDRQVCSKIKAVFVQLLSPLVVMSPNLSLNQLSHSFLWGKWSQFSVICVKTARRISYKRHSNPIPVIPHALMCFLCVSCQRCQTSSMTTFVAEEGEYDKVSMSNTIAYCVWLRQSHIMIEPFNWTIEPIRGFVSIDQSNDSIKWANQRVWPIGPIRLGVMDQLYNTWYQIPSQVWHLSWSCPRTRPHQVWLQSHSHRTPEPCSQTPHNQLRLSGGRQSNVSFSHLQPLFHIW